MEDGRVWVAWSWDYHPGAYKNPENTDLPSIFARPMDVDGSAGEKVHLVGTRGLEKDAVDLWPDLDFDPEGTLWCSCDFGLLNEGERGAIAARFDGEGFVESEPVVSTSNFFSYPGLSIGADGTKYLAWSERIGRNWRVRIVRDDKDGWSKPKEIAKSRCDLRFPVVTALNGNAWIAYEEHGGSGSRIRVKPCKKW